MWKALAVASICALAWCAYPATGVSAAVPAAITAAVADPARPDADKARDADRKPAETIAFAVLKSDDKIAELLPGGGYFTRIFSKLVGPKGHVYAVVPAGAPPARSAAAKAIAADPAYPNVTELELPLATLSFPEPVDMVWTSQNYHDLHNIQGLDVGSVNKAIFAALKPGGTYIVLDHAAAPGSGLSQTATLHRIDEAAVKTEVLAAGFTFEGESPLLHNPADDHSAKVFDPSIRGKTDQFILKFRKPAR